MSGQEKPLWSPAEREGTPMARFMRLLNERHGTTLRDFPELHAFSVERMEDFWHAVWDFGEVIGKPGERVLELSEIFYRTRFFPDATLNFAENLLRYVGDAPALIAVREWGARQALSRDALREQVAAFAAALRAAGIGAGDRVAGVVPNAEQAIVAFLACASIGAIWSSASPDFGARALLDRFGQLAPKVLIAPESTRYNGKRFALGEKLKEVRTGLPSVEKVVVFPFAGSNADAQTLAAELQGGITWEAFTAPHEGAEPVFTPLPFDHPLFILFSSGTTGKPKCIVHRAGGILLKHITEHVLHGGHEADSVLFYFTTCGWMMWNWLVSGLMTGATLVLYDGSPFHPGPERLFALAEAEGITHFGISAKYIDAVHKSGYEPAAHHDLSAMRMVYSTGSPLSPAGFDFVYEHVKPDVHLASISGGTDICGCFVGGNPLQPVWRGEIQGPILGMAVDVFDEDGRPVRGEKGELVCTQPFPSMPVGFWNDPGDKRYHDAYFARFENIWTHGDYAEITEHGGFIIHGRSDATLNPGGVRIGTAEIYAQLEEMEEVLDAVAVGQKTPDGVDERVVLFVVLKEGVELTDELRDRMRQRIRAGASPRHVPAVIAAVPDIPRTRSGKISEIAVRKVIHGEEVKNTGALANPEALEHFRDRPELAFD